MRDRRFGTRHKIGVLLGATGTAVAVLLLLVLGANASGACPEPETVVEGITGSVTLDSGHPTVEQELTISIPAEALPVTLAPGSVAVVPRLAYPSSPGLPTGEAAGPTSRRYTGVVDPSPPPPLRSQVFVHLIDRSTGRIVAHSGLPETRISPYHSDRLPAIPIDCPTAQDCQRRYILRLALADAGGPPLRVDWTPTLQIQYTREEAPCLPPSAEVDVVAGAPTHTSANARQDATIGSKLEHDRLIARHITIATTHAVAGTTTARFSVLGTHDPDPGWNAWARVVPDAGGAPIVEGLLGDERSLPHVGFLDAPVLTDCPAGQACSRGYWFVVQAIPGDPHRVYDGVSTNFGRFTWDLHAMTFGSDDATPGSLTATVDDVALDAEIFADSKVPGGTFEVVEPGRDRILPLTVTLPDSSDPIAFDRRVAAHVIVTVAAEERGASVDYLLRGPGVGASSSSGSSGRTQTSLIAHPLDGCTADVCQLELHARLSASSGSIGPRADVTWSATLVGFPVGTTVTAGEPVDGAGDPVPLDIPMLVTLLAPFAAAAAIAIVLVARARRLRRRLAV